MATPKQASYLAALVKGYPVHAEKLQLRSEGRSVTEYSDWLENNLRSKTAGDAITSILNYAKSVWPWRPLSRQSVAAEMAYQTLASRNMTRLGRAWYGTVTAEARKIGFQGDFRPLVFSVNRNGERIPLSKMEAEDAFRKQLSAVKLEVNKRLQNQKQDSEVQETHYVHPVDDEKPEFNEVEAEVKEEVEAEAEPAPVIEVDSRSELQKEADDLLRFVNNAHAMCEDARDPITGLSFDSVGFRWYLPSAALLVKGVPSQIIKSNLTRTWPLENKRALWSEQGAKFRDGIYVADSDMSRMQNPWDYDATDFKADPNIPGVSHIDENDHKATGLALTFLTTERLCWLIGPPGTGKTHLVGTCAAKLGAALNKRFPYVVLSLTRATSPSAFYGKQRIDGTAFLIDYMHAVESDDTARAAEIAKEAKEHGDVTISLFERIIISGGIIGLDEADRADPNTMQMLNAVIAQRYFLNPVSQTERQLHPDTMFMAMTNTEGLGANRMHNTADKMDDATVDRFRATRMFVGLDKELANRKFAEIIAAG